jgi:CO/xanthine dehydrogenase FAD-binding subunit
MKDINWYFPKSVKEVPDLLARGIPHAGGTGILRTSLNRISGLIDLRKLPLNYFKRDGGIIRIGALQTYTDVAKNMAAIHPEHILVKALRESASESLRNRITVGGSVAAFHPWSDIMGPLLALEAEVVLTGRHEGSYPVAQYVENRDLKDGTIIKEVSFRDSEWLSWYHRETRTSFDYGIFTITLLLSKNGGDIRILVTGTKKRFTRLLELEASIRDRTAGGVNIGEFVQRVEIDFPPKQRLDPGYIAVLARAGLEKGLVALLRR